MERRTWVLDLDGVLWRGHDPIPGSAESVRRLRDAGIGVLLVTNNAYATVASQLQRFAVMGIESGPDDLVTSAQVAARQVEPDEVALAVGGPGLHEALAARGARVVTSGPADAVVVGLHRELSYDDLAAAHRAIRGGARFIATNTDATFPTEQGDVPGAGAIVAAVATSTGQQPFVAGKPHRPVADYVRERVGQPEVCVGDRDDTDGMLARQLGCPFALVLSGVMTAADAAALDPVPDHVAPDLATLTARLLDGEGPDR